MLSLWAILAPGVSLIIYERQLKKSKLKVKEMERGFNNDTMSIERVEEILSQGLFVTFNADDTAIAMSIIDSLYEMVELFFGQHDEDSDYTITSEQYRLVIDELFQAAFEIVNKY